MNCPYTERRVASHFCVSPKIMSVRVKKSLEELIFRRYALLGFNKWALVS